MIFPVRLAVLAAPLLVKAISKGFAAVSAAFRAATVAGCPAMVVMTSPLERPASRAGSPGTVYKTITPRPPKSAPVSPTLGLAGPFPCAKLSSSSTASLERYSVKPSLIAVMVALMTALPLS